MLIYDPSSFVRSRFTEKLDPWSTDSSKKLAIYSYPYTEDAYATIYNYIGPRAASAYKPVGLEIRVVPPLLIIKFPDASLITD